MRFTLLGGVVSCDELGCVFDGLPSVRLHAFVEYDHMFFGELGTYREEALVEPIGAPLPSFFFSSFLTSKRREGV